MEGDKTGNVNPVVKAGGASSEAANKNLETLAPIQQENRILGFLRNLSWRGVACISIYFLGYFNFSLAWIITPLILSAARSQYKKEKRQRLAAAREAALTNEQATIESRLSADDLPTWVFFPDKERAEWINNMLKQLWPYVNNYVRATLFDTVEPMVKDILKGYNLKGFRFDREHVHLGQIPPRITGIKVYNERVTSRKEIIMDVDLAFASDLEVVFFLKLIKAKISEVSVRGMMRIVFKPLVSEIPLIGGVQAYFLSDPEIDYSLGGVAGALEMPGLSKIIDKIVLQQIRNFVVLPNKFVLPLVDTIPKQHLICPNTAGVLRVTLMKAKDLEQKDVGLGILKKGTSDPYAILTVGATTYKTRTITNSLNPIWNETYDFPIEVVYGQEFMMEFFDEDDGYDDEFLGRATVRTAAVADRGEITGFWVDLEECQTGKAQISLSWLPVTRDQKLVKELASNRSVDDENTKCIVHIFIDSCTGLDDMKNPAYKPSPLVQISCAKDVRQTWPKALTNDPVIEQGFVLLIRGPHSDDIHIKVLDSAKQNLCIGTATVNVWNLIQQPGMEFPLQPWILKSTSRDAKILMSLSVRGIKSHTGSPTKPIRESTPLVDTPLRKKLSSVAISHAMMDERVRAGRVNLVIAQANNLEKKDIGGKSDPYCVISYEDQESSTKVCKKTVDPIWNHEEILRVKENGDNTINIRVMDKDSIGKDELLGVTSIDVRQISKAGILSGIWDDLSQCKSGKIQYSAEFLPDPTTIEEEGSGEQVEEPVVSPASPDNAASNTSLLRNTESLQDFTEKKSVEDTLARSSDEISDSLEQGNVDCKDEVLPPRDVLEDLPAENVAVERDDTAEDPQVETTDSLQDEVPPDHQDLPAPAPAARQVPKCGFLHVTVHKAVDLMAKDFNGKSDPYVVIMYGDHKAKSKTVKKELNPVFDFSEAFYYPENGPQTLTIEVWDKDMGSDEFLGKVDVDLHGLVEGGTEMLNHWRELEGVDSGRIVYSIRFSQTQPDTSEVVRRPSQNNIISAAISPAMGLVVGGCGADIIQGESDGLRQRHGIALNGKIRLTLMYDENKCELKVFVHEASGLPGADLPDPPDPYVKVYLMPGKKKKKKTEVVVNSGNPRFDEEFDFEIDFSKVRQHSLKISVADKKGVFSKSPRLGVCHISLDNPGLTQGIADWYPLHHEDEDSD